MKDCPEAPESQPDIPVDPGPAQLPSGSVPYREIHLYFLLFVSFTAGAAISIIVNELLTATGSPVDTVLSILQNMWRAGGAGAVFTVIVAIIFKITKLLGRCWRKLPLKPQERRLRK